MYTLTFIQRQFGRCSTAFVLTIFFSSFAIAQMSYDGRSKLCLNGKDTIPLMFTSSVGEFGDWNLAHNREMRIIVLDGVINDELADNMQQLLLSLDNNKLDTITLIIRSVGGNVTAGLSIYDAMAYVKSPVKTIGYGHCASAAAILLSSGKKGLRCASRNCLILIHKAQPLDSGSDIAAILADRLNKILMEILAYNTGQSVEKLNTDVQTDYWMTTSEALEYGLIDSIID